MYPNTTSYKQQTGPAQSPYDKINSLLAMTVYHQTPFLQNGIRSKSCKYYLKWTKDPLHDNAADKLLVELENSVKCIQSKVNGQYYDNPITSIQLYYNTNKGGTIYESVPNLKICFLDIKKDGTIVYDVDVSFQNTKMETLLVDIMYQWAIAINPNIQ